MRGELTVGTTVAAGVDELQRAFADAAFDSWYRRSPARVLTFAGT